MIDVFGHPLNSPSKLESSCQCQVDPVDASADSGVCKNNQGIK